MPSAAPRRPAAVSGRSNHMRAARCPAAPGASGDPRRTTRSDRVTGGSDPSTGLHEDGEPACRRGSVHSHAGDRWPSIYAAYLGSARSPGRTGRPSPLLGLAPGGVYLAAPVARTAGALLPHRFTLACAVSGHRRSVLCGTFLRVAPTRFASTLPCGAPTFLDAEAPRPPSRLTVREQSATLRDDDVLRGARC